MKVSIAFMLLALGCCFAIPSGFNNQQTTTMKQEDAYYYTRYMQCILQKYDQALKSTSKDRDFHIKCTLNDLLTAVKGLAAELGCSAGDIFRQMGLSQLNVQEMEAMIQGEVSVDNLDPKICENLLSNLLGGIAGLLQSVLEPLLGTLKGVLDSIGVIGGILGGQGGLLGVVGGDNGLLGGLLGDDNGLLGGLLGGGNGGGGLLGGLLGGGRNGGPLGR